MSKAFGEEWRNKVEKLTKKQIVDMWQKDGEERSKVHTVPFKFQLKEKVWRKQRLAVIQHQITDEVLAELYLSTDKKMPIIEIKKGVNKGNFYTVEVNDVMDVINKLVKQ